MDMQMRAYEEHKKVCPKSKLTFEQFQAVLLWEEGERPMDFPKIVAVDGDQFGKKELCFTWSQD